MKLLLILTVMLINTGCKSVTLKNASNVKLDKLKEIGGNHEWI